MLTPIGNQTMEFLRESLSYSDNIEDQYLILELAARTTLFSCEQGQEIINILDFNEKNKKMLVVVITLFYKNIIDKQNFHLIKKNISDEKQCALFEAAIKTTSGKVVYPEHSKITPNNYDENPNVYIEKVAKVKNIGKNVVKTNDPNNDRKLIMQEEFNKKLTQLKSFFQKSPDELLKQIKITFESHYITSNNAMDILSNKTEKLCDEVKKDTIIEIYPYLYDPQNIERLIKTILTKDQQNYLRSTLLTMPNYYFEIKGEIKDAGCCCVMF